MDASVRIGAISIASLSLVQLSIDGCLDNSIRIDEDTSPFFSAEDFSIIPSETFM